MDPFLPPDQPQPLVDPYLDMAAMELGLGAIGSGLEMQVGPPWPPELSKPSRPKVADVLEAAQQEKEDHAIRLRVLELTHLSQHHRVSQVKVAAGRVHAKLHAQLPAPFSRRFKLRPQFGRRLDMLRAAFKYLQACFQVSHERQYNLAGAQC